MKRELAAAIVLALSCVGAVAQGQKVDSAVVVSKADPSGLARRCARYYARHYAKDWIGEATYWRTEKSCEHYDRLFAASGIWATFNFTQKSLQLYWDDKTIHYFLATDDCSTLPRIPGTKEADKVMSIPYNPQRKGIEQFLICYNHTHSQNIYANVRALELYSPLNLRHSADFEYELADIREAPDGLHYELNFKSSDGRFSKKTRIFLSGTLVMHESGRIEKIICNDLIDWYSDYIRTEVSCASDVENLANSEIIVEFGTHDGAQCVDKVVRTVKWMTDVIDSTQGKTLYAIENNTYRNPFKYSIESRTEMRISNHKVLEHQDSIKNLKRYFPSTAGFAMFFLDGDRRDSEIRTILSQMPGYEAVKCDIEDCGIDIWRQFDQSLEMYIAYAEMNFQNPEESIKRIRSRYEPARQLRSQIFGQD